MWVFFIQTYSCNQTSDFISLLLKELLDWSYLQLEFQWCEHHLSSVLFPYSPLFLTNKWLGHFQRWAHPFYHNQDLSYYLMIETRWVVLPYCVYYIMCFCIRIHDCSASIIVIFYKLYLCPMIKFLMNFLYVMSDISGDVEEICDMMCLGSCIAFWFYPAIKKWSFK